LIDVTLTAEDAVFVHVCYLDVSIDVDVEAELKFGRVIMSDVAVILINIIANC